MEIAKDEIELRFGPGGRNHLGPGTKSLRTWRTKLTPNSDPEDEIGDGPLRTSRTKLDPNSDLEDEITSDLEDEIGAELRGFPSSAQLSSAQLT